MEDVIQMENNVSMPHYTIMQARQTTAWPIFHGK